LLSGFNFSLEFTKLFPKLRQFVLLELFEFEVLIIYVLVELPLVLFVRPKDTAYLMSL